MADTHSYSLTRLLTVGLLTSQVAAHGYVQGIVANGQYYPGYRPSNQYLASQPQLAGWSDPKNIDNGPVPDYQSPDIICHLGATPGAAYAEVPAGGKVELQWTPWPVGHLGPVISYLANCNGECTSVDKTSLLFNKIEAVGKTAPGIPGTWAAGQLAANNNSWTLTIPSTIAAGNYVLRHEIISLQGAMTAGGAQNYPQCVNLKVTGSGTDSLQSGTKGTALYTQQDPGLLIDIYQALTTYPMPGPPLLGSAVSGNGTASGLNVTTPAIFSNATSALNNTASSAALLSSSATGFAIAGFTTPVVATPVAVVTSSIAPLASTTSVALLASTPSVAALSSTQPGLAFFSASSTAALAGVTTSTASLTAALAGVTTSTALSTAALASVTTSTAAVLATTPPPMPMPTLSHYGVQTFTTTEVVESYTTVSFVQGLGFTTVTKTITNTHTLTAAAAPSATTTTTKHTTVAIAATTSIITPAVVASIADAATTITPSVIFPILGTTFSTSTIAGTAAGTAAAARPVYTGALFGSNDTLAALASGTGLVLSIRPLATGLSTGAAGVASASGSPSLGFIGVPVDNGFRAKQRRRQALRDLWGQ